MKGLYLAVGIFCMLHGFVHLIYAGHSLGFYQMEPGMTWPQRAWISPLLGGDRVVHVLAAAGAAVAATAFLLAGLVVTMRVSWGLPVAVAAAAFSSLFFLLFWNGRLSQLANQGLVGVAINAVLFSIAFAVLRFDTGG